MCPPRHQRCLGRTTGKDTERHILHSRKSCSHGRSAPRWTWRRLRISWRPVQKKMGAFRLWGASISASLHTCFRKKCHERHNFKCIRKRHEFQTPRRAPPRFLLTRHLGSIPVARVFCLVTSRWWYQMCSHPDREERLASWAPREAHQRTTKKQDREKPGERTVTT